MTQSGIIHNSSPISMEEAKSILNMAIDASKKLRERLSKFNTNNIKTKQSDKDTEKSR